MVKLTKEQIVQNAQELITQLQAACTAIESETNPENLLNHVGAIRDQGRIEALRRVVRDRALELFDGAMKSNKT